MTKRTAHVSAVAIVLGVLVAACDKVPLIAPSGSAISLSANSSTVPTNGTVGLTAFVMESSGTPVQNGTTVRFTTTLGTVTPTEAQTTNGVAVATFNAGANSGIATIHAISGGAGGGTGSTGTGTGTGTGTTTGSTSTNVVTITVGVAAVKTITVNASPTSVGPNGGSVTVTATALDPNGGSLAGIPVTFSADHGGVDPGVVTTDASGQATTTLTTSAETKVTASAGPATATATVTLRAAPAITIKCTPASGTGTCAAVAASDASNTATVTFDIAKATGSSALRDATISFGDGITQGLGTLAAPVSIAHSYNGSSNGTTATYSAAVTVTDVDNERSTASTIVNVTPRGALAIDLAASQATSVPGQGQTVTFTATVAGGVAQSFAWDYDGDGTVDATTSSNKITRGYTSNGRQTATVTVQTIDGRSATARTEFIVTGI
jgi:hypothetical protein